jgi:hypothetical protein
MTRTIITIDDQDKDWLTSYSRAQRQSMAETIRQAVRRYRDEVSVESETRILRETAGIWRVRGKDGLEYQRELRSEWTGGNR